MKKFGGFHRKALVLALIPLVAHCGEPEQRFEVKVCDEKGQPMEAVACKAWFNKPKKGEMGLTGYRVDARTDKTGLAVLQGATSLFETTVVAEKKGCYKSGASKLWITGKKNAARWEPWPVEVDLVLKKIVNPHPMYAVRSHGGHRFPFPGGQLGPFGFDLMAGDWVAPHGKGKIADFVIEGRKDDPNDQSRKPDGVIKLRFSNPGDGIRRMPDEIGGSLCVGPLEAPEDGYEDSREFRNIKYKPDGGRSIDFSEQVHVFRIRTRLDAEGNVVDAHYGKIHGVLLGRLNATSPWLKMTYYLNAKANERGLEWDRKTNLLGNVAQEDWPRFH